MLTQFVRLTEQMAYVFGGHSCFKVSDCGQSEITRHDAATKDVRLVGYLPSSRSGAAAVYLQGKYYVIGGFSCAIQRVDLGGGVFQDKSVCTSFNEIVVVDPSQGSVTVSSSQLPSGRSGLSAATMDGKIYLFGGKSCVNGFPSNCTDTSEILRFDPVDGTIVKVGDLPSPRSGTSAVAVNESIYVIGGGKYQACETLSDVLVFNPSTNVTSPTGMNVGARTLASALYDGRSIFVFGGSNGCDLWYRPSELRDDIFRIDPILGLAYPMADRLDARTYGAGAAYAGGRRLMFGGTRSGSSSEFSDLIYEYSVKPGAPSALAAAPGADEINLSWQPPLSNSFVSPIAAYRIYRGASASSLVLLAELGGESTSYRDRGLGKGATRYYSVQAVNADGAGSMSSAVSARTWSNPGPPTNVRVDLTAIEGVKLSYGALPPTMVEHQSPTTGSTAQTTAGYTHGSEKSETSTATRT